jgi:hypothetical protein
MMLASGVYRLRVLAITGVPAFKAAMRGVDGTAPAAYPYHMKIKAE